MRGYINHYSHYRHETYVPPNYEDMGFSDGSNGKNHQHGLTRENQSAYDRGYIRGLQAKYAPKKQGE